VVSCKTIPETLPAKELVLRSLRSEQLLLIEDTLLKIKREDAAMNESSNSILHSVHQPAKTNRALLQPN
jgi:hypothetical protein